MRIFLVFSSIVTPAILGFLLLSVVWPKGRPFFADFLLKCCLSVGLGFGVSSCLVFAWMALAGHLNRTYFLCELFLFLILCLLLFRRMRRPANEPVQVSGTSFSSRGKPYWLRGAVFIALVSAVLQFTSMSALNPHGQFDAYSIWNLRARFLYRGGENWTHFKYMAWSHPDYPLLLPASIARCWEFTGEESQVIPIAIAFLFTFSMIALVALSVSRVRGERQGLLAGLLLLCTPFLISHGASQYADVPLSFFFAATVVFLLLHAESPLQPNFLVLAGLAAGLAAWTKNEGILFLGAFFLSYLLATAPLHGISELRRAVQPWLAGVAPVLLVILVYKVSLGGSNDVVSAHGLGSNVHNLWDFSKYRLIIAECARGVFTFGQWSRAFSMPVLMLFYLLLLGASFRKNVVQIVAVSLTILMVIGYFCVYLISPYDLRWHLETSLGRLFLQVWPIAIVAYFMIVRSPDEAVLEEG